MSPQVVQRHLLDEVGQQISTWQHAVFAKFLPKIIKISWCIPPSHSVPSQCRFSKQCCQFCLIQFPGSCESVMDTYTTVLCASYKITLTSCCNTGSERPHRCCHLPNNFRSWLYSLHTKLPLLLGDLVPHVVLGCLGPTVHIPNGI